ncbi:hypothetical protein F2Q69_00024472 [Brassica cretica]|uniref:Mannan endo-1,4-beta-mannosidase n=1 Tax=Brassica cretica TaxID=69181 RepID=A0A8S9Q0Q8_BRACR|nr:hypothetical protein F2Q69_00024472 [Brassica cretica]
MSDLEISDDFGASWRYLEQAPEMTIELDHRYMQQGAEAVHGANPNVLVILSGLTYDTDLSFVRSRPVTLTFSGKLAFEIHQYYIPYTNIWSSKNPNDACGDILKILHDGVGFNLREFPVFLSEFGIDVRGFLAKIFSDSITASRYMQQGAEAVHKANPNVLVILSGLTYDTDLSFVRSRPVTLTFSGKLVFEIHQYYIPYTNIWSSKNPNDACGDILKILDDGVGFNLREFPVFLSEFGIDVRGVSVVQNRDFGCLLGWAVENDVDWSIWALAGSYYIRESVVGMIDYYGVLDSDWIRPDPQPKVNNLVFHPLSGLCMLQSFLDPIKVTLGRCNESQLWNYSTDNTLKLQNKSLCLANTGPNAPVVKLSETNCSSSNLSKWQTISASKMLLAATSTNNSLCLDVDGDNNIVATNCKCVNGEDGSCDPMSQWFKIVKVTI